jgi:hypothetical protein
MCVCSRTHARRSINDVPRVRHLVHRSLLSTTTARPLLVSTTDVRTPKGITTIFVWLCCGASLVDRKSWGTVQNHRKRIRPRQRLGMIFTGASRSTSLCGECSDEDEGGGMKWWEKERIATFDHKMGDVLRASFVRPIPGSPLLPLLGRYGSAKEWPERLPRIADVVEGTTEADQVTEALNNFALVSVPARQR